MIVVEALPGQGVQLGGSGGDLQANTQAYCAFALGPAGGPIVRAADRAGKQGVKEGQPVGLGVELCDQEGLPVEV